MTREEEIEQLSKELKESDAAAQPKRERLNSLLMDEAKEVEARIKHGAKFDPDDLIWAASSRCSTCQAGLAYPKKSGPWGSWYCSKQLTEGRASGEMLHVDLPFSMYEVKSDIQPSADGRSTRPNQFFEIVDGGESWFYVAPNQTIASKIHLDLNYTRPGVAVDPEDLPDSPVAWSPDKEFTFRGDNGSVTKKVQEWLKELPVGLFATTCC